MLLRIISLLVFAAVAACGALPVGNDTASPAQKIVNATAVTCKDNAAAITATDQAVLAGVLKGNDARNATKGLATIQAACVSTLAGLQAAAAAASSAASGASK